MNESRRCKNCVFMGKDWRKPVADMCYISHRTASDDEIFDPNKKWCGEHMTEKEFEAGRMDYIHKELKRIDINCSDQGVWLGELDKRIKAIEVLMKKEGE